MAVEAAVPAELAITGFESLASARRDAGHRFAQIAVGRKSSLRYTIAASYVERAVIRGETKRAINAEFVLAAKQNLKHLD